jgi:SAM-dependent methyltransferase
VVSGVRSYTGCDPKIDLDSSVLTHLRTRDMQPADCTLRALMRRLPHVSYVRGTVANLPLAQWDIAVLHNTTEHLMDIDEVFAAVSERLKPGGLLIFRHHNYFAWNGHHLAPRDISRINTADPDQQKVIDWEHIAREPEPGSYAATHLNRIQLDHLRIVTERYYVVDEWREMVSSVSEGRMRLTPEILRRHASFSRRELETQSVYCVARRSSSSVALDSEPNGNRHLMKPREPSNQAMQTGYDWLSTLLGS